MTAVGQSYSGHRPYLITRATKSPLQETGSSNEYPGWKEIMELSPDQPQHVDLLTRLLGSKWAPRVKGWVLGLVAGIVTLIAIVGFVTLIQTHTVLGDVQDAQKNHTQTITDIIRVWENDYASCVKLGGGAACYPPPPHK